MIERLLLLLFVIIAAIRWIYVRRRFRQLEQRIDALTRPAPPGPAAEPDLARRDRKETARRDEPSPPTDWEAEVGANWLNKLGMFVLVIGMALALGYSFRYLGPLGRVAISAAASFAMIAAGIMIERPDRYRTFGRGLIGGGWAALYFTAYATHAVDAARVIENPVAAALLLMIVAAGMIIQSLRYRSEGVTGLAYFIAFVTLAITEATTLSLAALVPLAASLLYVSRRFSWSRFALLGLIATYLTCAFRGETGAPLWHAQSIFAIYWLLFEGFDIFSRSNWLLPLNAAGFVGLSLIEWDLAVPDRIWQFLAATAAAYLASAALRGRAGRGAEAAAISAALAAAAVFLKLDNQWRALALLTQAELVYLAGLRLRVPLLRYIAGVVFALEVGHLLLWERTGTWTSIAVLNAATFYLNRFLAISDFVFGYAGAGMLALVVYHEAPTDRLGLYWILLAAGPFAIGWMRRLADFRFQSYILAGFGLCGMLWHRPEPSFSLLIAAAAFYTGTFAGSRSDRFLDWEADLVRYSASFLGAILVAAFLDREVAESMLTVAWGAEGLALLGVGFPLRDRTVRFSGLLLLLICILKLFLYDLSSLDTLPRILSFIGLGLILVGVSWLYTRFHERIRRYL